MSKRLICLLAVIFSAMINIVSMAEDEAFSFRNVIWYSHPSAVSSEMKLISGVTTPWFGSIDKNAHIEGWFKKWEYFYTDDSIDDGGVILKFSHVPIAGYIADVELSFMWSIKNEKVDYSYDNAEFYMGIYTIDGYKDLLGVYNELKEKLKVTYGDCVSQSYYDGGMEGVKWLAKDGSLIWLRIRMNTVFKYYEDITLTFFAPDGEARLKELSNTMRQEVVNREEERREQNKDNFEGL